MGVCTVLWVCALYCGCVYCSVGVCTVVWACVPLGGCVYTEVAYACLYSSAHIVGLPFGLFSTVDFGHNPKFGS